MKKKTLKAKGFIPLPIKAKSFAQVVEERLSHFWKGELGYLNDRINNPYSDLREYTPPVIFVVVNPNQLFIPDNFSHSQGRRLQIIEIIEKYSRQEIEIEFPGAKAVMLPATVSAQADIAYFDRTGKVLLGNHCVGALDKSFGSFVAFVSRNLPGRQLDVFDWYAGYSPDSIGVLLALVFLRR